MIYTSYFAKLKSLPDNVIPISICGKAPDWYNGLRYYKLAPNYDFFMKWKENHDNNYYIKCFKEQITDKLDVERVLNELHWIIPFEIRLKMDKHVCLSSKWHVALICYEKPSYFCHRHLVADWINKHGFECKEWQYENE